eukprot:gene22361-29459_t
MSDLGIQSPERKLKDTAAERRGREDIAMGDGEKPTKQHTLRVDPMDILQDPPFPSLVLPSSRPLKTLASRPLQDPCFPPPSRPLLPAPPHDPCFPPPSRPLLPAPSRPLLPAPLKALASRPPQDPCFPPPS